VLFDAGHTLLRVERSVGHIYAEVAARYQVVAAPDSIETVFRSLWDARRDTLHAGTSDEREWQWWKDLVADVFGDRCREFVPSFDAFFGELYELFSTPRVWRVFDDVVPALDALERAGVRRAVVSNWDSRLPLLLERVGLAPRFEFVLTSAQAGFRKPDRRIFQEALARLGLCAGQVAYVGDSYDEDFIGARDSGLAAVLIAREGCARAQAGALTTLADLPRWLEERYAN
jgi:putative hydrolase of the HAD superfamily